MTLKAPPPPKANGWICQCLSHSGYDRYGMRHGAETQVPVARPPADQPSGWELGIQE